MTQNILISISIILFTTVANAQSPLTHEYEQAKQSPTRNSQIDTTAPEFQAGSLSQQEIEVIYGGTNLDRHYYKWQHHKDRWPQFVDYEYRYARRKYRRGVLLTTTGIITFTMSIPTMVLFAPSNIQDDEEPNNEPYEGVPLIFFAAAVAAAVVSVPATIWGIFLIKKYKRIRNKLHPYVTPTVSNNSMRKIDGLYVALTVRF
ncbi:MAG: hypothetical protein JXR76_02230 [Deltaproteobacteria bacterium]|nr:hypothetical protein [Deltaproteobacteria bacterium]